MRNRVYVFIDASNLWQAQKAKGYFFDYAKLICYIKEKFSGDKIKVFYYTAFPGDGTRSYSLDGKFKFFTFLGKGLGFVVRKKKLKQIRVIDDIGEHIEEKGNMDVEMTIDAIHFMDDYEVAVFLPEILIFLPWSAIYEWLKKEYTSFLLKIMPQKN